MKIKEGNLSRIALSGSDRIKMQVSYRTCRLKQLMQSVILKYKQGQAGTKQAIMKKLPARR
jgi:hypothetical protein